MGRIYKLHNFRVCEGTKVREHTRERGVCSKIVHSSGNRASARNHCKGTWHGTLVPALGRILLCVNVELHYEIKVPPIA